MVSLHTAHIVCATYLFKGPIIQLLECGVGDLGLEDVCRDVFLDNFSRNTSNYFLKELASEFQDENMSYLKGALQGRDTVLEVITGCC